MTHARSGLHQPSPAVGHEDTDGDSNEAPEDFVSDVRITLALIGLVVFIVLPGIAVLSLVL